MLSPHQHGFNKGLSREMQLLQLSDELTSNMERGLQTNVVGVDSAKAFEKVNHSLLTNKLDHHGSGGQTKAWISSFLRDRRQTVVMKVPSLSQITSIDVKSGVLQGLLIH